VKLLLIILCTVLLLSPAAPAQAQIGRWTPPINVSNAAGYSIMPDMAIGPDGRIHVVWADNARTLVFNNYDILYSVYTENSSFWSTPVQLSPLADTYSGDPRIAVDSQGIPHVVWTHRNLYPESDIYYSTLTDSGWTLPLNLSTIDVNHRGPDIVVDAQDYIHVVWSQYLDGAFNVVHRYYDGGQWSELINASNSTVNVSQQRLARGLGDELHLVWFRPTGGGYGDIYYSRYDGLSWSPGQDVSQSPGTQSIEPDLAVDIRGNPHVVWEEHLNPNVWEIFYGRFDGLCWSAPQNISNQQMLSTSPQIAFNSQNLCCVLFTKQLQSGLPPYVQYTFKQGYAWTHPDTMLCNYLSFKSAISADSSGIFHSSLTMSPGLGMYGDIQYTQFQNLSSMLQRNNLRDLNHSSNKPMDFKIFPNPFNQSVAISFPPQHSDHISATIYDIRGNLVKTIYPILSAGDAYEMSWDGTSQFGICVSTGTYFLKLQSQDESIIKKVDLVK